MTFPESFFTAEYRLDFFISKMMKHAWAAKLELLEVVTDICQKHDLEYFACGGTLLGAVRHKGFIPWDDDIDIGLKRPAYNKLIKILPDELPYGFSLGGMYARVCEPQNFLTCDQSVVVTNASQWNLTDFYKRFHGFPYRTIGIDIYPYDYIPRDSELSNLQKYLVQQITILVREWKALSEAGKLENQISEIEKLCNVSFTHDSTLQRQLMQLSDTICSLYTEAESDEIANYPTWITYERDHMKKEWYDEIIYVPFENTTIAIPKYYHEVLSVAFSDYMTPSPLPSLHNYPFYASQEKALKSYLEKQGYTGTIDDFCRDYLSGK